MSDRHVIRVERTDSGYTAVRTDYGPADAAGNRNAPGFPVTETQEFGSGLELAQWLDSSAHLGATRYMPEGEI